MAANTMCSRHIFLPQTLERLAPIVNDPYSISSHGFDGVQWRAGWLCTCRSCTVHWVHL